MNDTFDENGLPLPAQSETDTHSAMKIGATRNMPRMINTGDTKSHPAARSARSDLVRFLRILREGSFFKIMTYRAFLPMGILMTKICECSGVGPASARPAPLLRTMKWRLVSVQDALHRRVGTLQNGGHITGL